MEMGHSIIGESLAWLQWVHTMMTSKGAIHLTGGVVCGVSDLGIFWVKTSSALRQESMELNAIVSFLKVLS
jgi:hypothetical protein